jgi:flagellar hook-associated protein 1 FlgK
MDKRDLALDQLAELTGSVSSEQKNGEMIVSIGGHVLVVGHEAIKLHAQTNNNIADIYWEDNQKLVPSSGKLKGTLDVRDRVLVDRLTGLNTLAAGLMTQVNTIHSGGFGLNNSTGNAFFTATAGSEASTLSVNSLLDAASIATSSNTGQAGNNEIALQIAALKSAKSMKANTVTLNEFYNAQITDLALITQHATDNTYQNGLVAKALGDQRESVAGVSLDEEAANMAKAQRAYEASARILTAFDELLDRVINNMGLVGR